MIELGSKKVFLKYFRLYFLQTVLLAIKSYGYHQRFMVKFCSFSILLLSISTTAHSAIFVDSLVYVQSFSDTSKKDPVLSVDIDLKSEPGKIILAPGKTKNLALGSKMKAVYAGSFPVITVANEQKPDTNKMNADNLHDNNGFTYVQFNTPSNVGSQIKIDLHVVRKVDSIVVVHLGGRVEEKQNTGYNTRPRAFSYYTGLDSNRMSRVRQVFDNLDSARHSENLSPPEPIQYILFELERMDNVNHTVISEFQIFGEGFVVEGSYASKIDSTGSLPANFANVFIDGEIEKGTSVSIQMRTGNSRIFDSTRWSGWSAPIVFRSSAEAAKGAPLSVAEPRKYFQYRLILGTANLFTPKVNGIKFVYQNTLVADSTSVRITPQDIPVLNPAQLRYTIKTYLSPLSLGIDTIKISTPSPSTVRSVSVNGIAAQYGFLPAPNLMTIVFPLTVTNAESIDIVFSTKLVEAGTFPGVLISRSAPWNPQRADPAKTASGDGWTVTTLGVPLNPIEGIRVSPNPFTPNGDGKNDATIIDFAVTKIDKPKPLRIKVFDLTGRKVRTIVDMQSGVNPFFGDPRSGGKAFLWDGTDDDGKLVRPGVYILQVTLDVDNGGQFITKTITIAY